MLLLLGEEGGPDKHSVGADGFLAVLWSRACCIKILVVVVVVVTGLQ